MKLGNLHSQSTKQRSREEYCRRRNQLLKVICKRVKRFVIMAMLLSASFAGLTKPAESKWSLFISGNTPDSPNIKTFRNDIEAHTNGALELKICWISQIAENLKFPTSHRLTILFSPWVNQSLNSVIRELPNFNLFLPLLGVRPWEHPNYGFKRDFLQGIFFLTFHSHRSTNRLVFYTKWIVWKRQPKIELKQRRISRLGIPLPVSSIKR